MSGGGDGFGGWLLSARTRAGLTQEGLGRLAGVPRETIGRIEAGRPPERATEHRLRTALDMRLGDAGASVEAAVRRRQFLGVAAVVPATLALRMIALDRSRAPAPLSEPLLDNWEERTANFAAARALEPPRLLLPQIEQHLMVLEARIAEWPGPAALRRRLLSIVAGTNAIAAWVSLMAERRRETHDYLDRGEALAREAGDDDALMLLLMLRADLLSPVLLGGDGGFSDLALRALDEGIALAGPTAPKTLYVPLILRAAEERAFLGDEPAVRRLLAAGEEAQERSRVPDHYLRRRWPAWSLDSYRGSALQLLGQSREAIETLEPIRSPYPSHQPLLLADRGAAHARAGDVDEATRLLGEALLIAMAHGYPEAARRVQGVRRRHLGPWDGEPRIRQLDEQIAAIL